MTTDPCSEGAADRRSSRIDRLEALIADLRATVADIGTALVGHATTLADLERGIGDVRDANRAQLADMDGWLRSTVHTVNSLSNTPVGPSATLQAAGPAARAIDEGQLTRRLADIWVVMNYLRLTPTSFEDTTISVIMRTRDRAAYLEQAMASVLAQRHRNLELVVVNDGSTDGTAQLLDAIDDARVRVVTTRGRGAMAAGNVGLEAARGSIVTYLDDDNIMDPGWLHAVAWAFDRWPDKQLLYGGRVIEDAPAGYRRPSGAMPSLEWKPFDRRTLEQACYMDMNVLAHRAGLSGCRFDETLGACGDWQLALTLTASIEPLELPAIACLYRTYAPQRLLDMPGRLEHNRRVRSRIHTTRAMRILSHHATIPITSETAVSDEMCAVKQHGAQIGYSLIRSPEAPSPIAEPLWFDLADAVAEFDPDLIFVYWSTQADNEWAALDRLGRPFALRVHSSDVDIDQVREVQAHPHCIGVWADPRHVPLLPGAQTLEQVCPPDLGPRLHAQLSDALTVWRLKVG